MRRPAPSCTQSSRSFSPGIAMAARTIASRRWVTVAIATAWLAVAPAASGIPVQPGLPEPAAEVLRRAQGGRWWSNAARLNPEILPTSDGRSFVVVWRPAGSAPTRWIVSLHGSRGFATDDLAIWSPSLEGRDLGIVCLQWWIGTDDSTSSYLTPVQIDREIGRVLQRLGVKPGRAMLHGFSRGAANIYAVAALDAGGGRRSFALVVASSGGVAEDYPPTRALLAGSYGDHPLRGTRWVTAAGARDPHPDRDGIPAMRRTAEWLVAQGAVVVERIEDPSQGHGALQLDRANARHLVDLFLKESVE